MDKKQEESGGIGRKPSTLAAHYEAYVMLTMLPLFTDARQGAFLREVFQQLQFGWCNTLLQEGMLIRHGAIEGDDGDTDCFLTLLAGKKCVSLLLRLEKIASPPMEKSVAWCIPRVFDPLRTFSWLSGKEAVKFLVVPHSIRAPSFEDRIGTFVAKKENYCT